MHTHNTIIITYKDLLILQFSQLYDTKLNKWIITIAQLNVYMVHSNVIYCREV